MIGGRTLVHSRLLDVLTPGPTLSEMIDDVTAEAARIEIVQAGLIDSGHRAEPDAAQIRRLAILDKLSRFLRLVGRYEPEVRSLLQQLQQRERTRK